MGWQIVAFVVCIFSGYWFVAFLLACSMIYRWVRSTPELPAATHEIPPHFPSAPRRSQEVTDLLVLRLELARQLATGAITQESYRETVAHIDTLTTKTLEELDIAPDSRRWNYGKEAAWKLLITHGLLPQSPPPWQRTPPDAGEQFLQDPLQLPLPLPPRSASQPDQSAAPPAALITAPTPLPAIPVPPLPAETAVLLETPTAVPPPASPPLTPSPTATHPQPRASSEWKPPAPTAMERALQAVSGWPAVLVPFLVQNSLWFIGMFCIVAAATLLVSYTTGFWKAVSVSASLSAGTLFLLWQGYRLRQHHPEMEAASRVFLILGVLLIPLDIATAVRLIATGQSLPWIVLGSVVTGVSLGGLFYATMLVSGVMDRALQGQHPRLFLALVATQLAVPLLQAFPSWPLLAVTHCVVLGLLAYGLVRFVHGWLHTLFVEQQKGAYYAAGTLVYAAVVSFFHLTWGYNTASRSLPAGYYGPFLMALCGLLFYVDAQFKHWTKQYAFLSRFSFLVYGLSVVALLVSASAPPARLLTLSLGMGVYSLVVWQYLTLPPLYLLLGCAGWLYHLLFLQYLPHPWYLLASLPGIVALFAASLMIQRRSARVALIGYRVWFVAALLLTAWSLAHAQPSLVAMSTALAMMGLLFSGLRFAPPQLFGVSVTPHAAALIHSPWLYAVTLMGVVAVVYAPLWIGLTQVTQCAFGLTLLAVGWSRGALHLRRTTAASRAFTVEVLLNSALLNLSLALVLAVTLLLPGLTHSRALPLLLGTMGGVLLWMSLTLRARELVYGVLALWGAAGAIIKLTYFPHPATGVIELSVALLVWGLVWWLEHGSEEIKTLRHEQATLRAQQYPPLTLLWSMPVSSAHTYEEVLRLPLVQAMVVLWGIGLIHIGRQLPHGWLGWGGTLAATLGALATVIGGGYFRLPLLLPLALTLGLGACLSTAAPLGVAHLGVTTFAAQNLIVVWYALLVWRAGLFVLAHPHLPGLARFLHLGGDRTLTDSALHWTTFGMTLLGCTLPLGWYGVFIPNGPLLGALSTGMVFLWLAGHHYRQWSHSYDLLALVVLTAVLGYTWTLPAPGTAIGLLRDPQLGLLAVGLGLWFWLMATILSGWARKDPEASVVVTHTLYTEPLSHTAIVLAVFAALQQFALVWGNAVRAITPIAIGIVLLASVALLLVNRLVRQPALTLVSVLLAVLAVLWTEALTVHPGIAFSLWPGGPTFIDAWLTLSLLALGLTVLVHRVWNKQQWQTVYSQPLLVAASLVYGWTLLGTGAFFIPTPFRSDVLLPLTFVVLALGLFPLLRPFPVASMIRGLALPLFGSAVLVSVLALTGLSEWISFTALLWGYVLWSAGNFALPRWNSAQPRWAVAPEAWPWYGLTAVSFSLLNHLMSGVSHPWLRTLEHSGFCAAGSLYFFLMLRNSAWSGFPWFAALLLTWSGASLNEAWSTYYWSVRRSPLYPVDYAVGNLLWVNILLRVVPAWRQHGHTLSARWQWRTSNLATPFLVWPTLLLFPWVLYLFFGVIDPRFGSSLSAAIATWLPYCLVGGGLTLSFFHLWWLHRAKWETHVVLASLFCTMLAAWRGSAAQFFHPPLFLALWTTAAFLGHLLWEKHQWGAEQLQPLRHTLSRWVAPSLVVAIVATLAYPELPLTERLISLAALIGITVGLSWQRQQLPWFLTAGVLVLVFVHIWPLLWVPSSQIALLLPWYALQLAALTWVALWSSEMLRRRFPTEDGTEDNLSTKTGFRLVASLLSLAWPLVALLAVVEWGLHNFTLVAALMRTGHPQWLSSADTSASLIAVALLLALGVRQAQRSQQPEWVYGTTLLGGAVGVYIRLLQVGLAPVSVWDTTALMTATYLLFALQRVTASTPLLHMVMAMPLFTLLTIPLQTASPHASMTFITAATLYLLTYRETDRPLPLYLALIALNAAIYIWVPVWANQLHVMQLWVSPAALSVLFMLHVHRDELKPSVLSNARLAATCVLYASATGDVFLQDNLALFALVLVLSVAGILLGVALRTKAFLYGGTSFLVFNILGQLFIHVPEHALGRAILLFVVGVSILGGKFWFDLQRETFLRRIRIFRADLETWE